MTPTRRRVWVAGAALIVALPITGVHSRSATAQLGADIDLISQTMFVGSEPAVLEVSLAGAPAGAELDVQIHAPPADRGALVDAFAGIQSTSRLAFWTIGAAELDATRAETGDVVSIVVPDDEIGEGLRSEPGPHPVVLQLRLGEVVLDTMVTALLVKPTVPPAPIRVAVVVDLTFPLALGPDRTPEIAPGLLGPALDTARTMIGHVETPVSVILSPETFDALVAEGDAQSLAWLQAATVGNHVFTSPWVETDEVAWLDAGREDVVRDLYARGTDALVASGVVPVPVVRLDSNATPATVGVLARSVALANGEDVTSVGYLIDPALVDDDLVATGPIRLIDDDGNRHRALVPDGTLLALLDRRDAELGVTHMLAELLRLAMSTPGGASVVVDVGELDPAVLDLLLGSLDTDAIIAPAGVATLLDSPPATIDGTVVSLTPNGGSTTNLQAHAARRSKLEHQLNAYASMVADDSVVGPLRRLVDAGAADVLTTTQRDTYLDAVAEELAAGLAGFDVVDGGRVTLTSRRTELPLVLINDQPSPMVVTVHLGAEKLSFPEGDRLTMVLEPGQNPRTVAVETRASGDASINVRITTPDEGVELATGVVQIRSTAISGLGLVISVVALAVLVVWWVRSGRARRSIAEITTASVASASPSTSPSEELRT